MLLYNFFVLLLFFPFCFSKNELLKDGLFLLLMIYVAFLAMFQTGSPDLDNYKLIFYGEYYRHIESLYSFITLLFRLIGFSFYVFWTFQALLLSFLLYKLFQFFSYDKLFSAILFVNSYFISKQLIQTRNFISILILLFMLRFVSSQKYKKAFLFYGLSSGIHYSSLLSSPLFFSNQDRFQRLICFATIISIVFLAYPIGNLLSRIENLNISDKYILSYYLVQLQTKSSLGKSLFQIVRGIFILIMIAFNLKRFDYKDKVLATMVLEGLFIKFMFSSVGHLGSRLSEVFLFGEVLLLPNITKYIHNKILYKSILVAYSFFLLVSTKNTYPQFLETFSVFDYH